MSMVVFPCDLLSKPKKSYDEIADSQSLSPGGKSSQY
jgi:hypothetical protein